MTDTDALRNFPYLFAAYTVVWAAIFGYVISIFWRQRALRDSIEGLKKRLAEKDKK